MLATDERQIRWMGIDLRARWRRRVAVIGTYCVFAVLTGIATDDGLAFHPRWTAHVYLALITLIAVTMIWRALSVFRPNGVVKSFEDPPEFVGLQGKVMVNGLDEWARYRFDVASFEEASEEQQADLLKRYRVGTFLMPAKPRSSWLGLDEREKGERDGAARWALKQVAIYLAIWSGIYASEAARHQSIDPVEMVAEFWLFSILAQTLPQARVLWTEPDPREMAGEMELLRS